MTHLVVFKSAEGKQAYHQAPELDDALRFIEHLKNAEGIDKAKLFKLDEVPLEFKMVVKVEVAGDDAPSVLAAPVDDSPVSKDEPEPELVDAGSSKRRFGL